MSIRLQNLESNLAILNYQMGVLTRYVGYLTSYTISDNEFEQVKKYVADNIEKCRHKPGHDTREDLQEKKAALGVWLSIQDQLQS